MVTHLNNTTDTALGNTAFGHESQETYQWIRKHRFWCICKYQISTGNANTAVGYGTLFANTSGSNNTVGVGMNSGLRVTTGIVILH